MQAKRLLSGTGNTTDAEANIIVHARTCAAAAIASVQVAAVEAALLYMHQNANQLQFALNTGIVPGNILRNAIAVSPPPVPQWEEPQPGFSYAPFSGISDVAATEPFVGAIVAHIMEYGRLTTDARDFLVGAGNAALLANAPQPETFSQAISILTFYPRHEATLLLLSNLYLSKGRPMVAAHLCSLLIDNEKRENRAGVAEYSNMAVALHQMVSQPHYSIRSTG